MTNEPQKTTKQINTSGVLVLLFFFFSVCVFIWAVFFSQPPEERARIKAMEAETQRITEKNQQDYNKLVEEKRKLETAKVMVSSVFTIEDVEKDFNKGDYMGALELADIILSGNPDSITVLQIANICEKIANTGPTGSLAKKLYDVSDKGQKLIQSRQGK